MARIIIATTLFGGFSLVAAGFFFRRVYRYFQWRKKTSMPLWGQLILILLPMTLTLVVFGQPLLKVPAECPVPLSELKEITAPVDYVQERESHQASGRSVRVVKRYRIYLEGCSDYLYIPDNFRFDQDAFLHWAGPEEITFLYARTGGRFIVYQIQRGTNVFLSYSHTHEMLTTTFLTDLFANLTMLLLGLGGSVYLPEFLSPRDKAKRGERILFLVFAASALVLFVFLSNLVGQPKVTESPADTSDLLAVTVEEGVTLTLPRGWQESSTTDSGGQWYSPQDKGYSCFQAAYYVGGSAGDDWYDAFLHDFRARLLEQSIKTPYTTKVPFLEEYTSSAGLVPGTDFLVSEGWGTSINGYKSHFLLVLLPEQQIGVVIKSASRQMSWSEMENYVQEWVWPLLARLDVDGM